MPIINIVCEVFARMLQVIFLLFTPKQVCEIVTTFITIINRSPYFKDILYTMAFETLVISFELR